MTAVTRLLITKYISKLAGICGFCSPDLATYDFWLFPKLKSPLKGRRFVNAKVTQYTSSVNGVSLPND